MYLCFNRNWCAFVITKTVSCVVEDGVETYVKPDYHPCSWGSGQCSRVVVWVYTHSHKHTQSVNVTCSQLTVSGDLKPWWLHDITLLVNGENWCGTQNIPLCVCCALFLCSFLSLSFLLYNQCFQWPHLELRSSFDSVCKHLLAVWSLPWTMRNFLAQDC